jgi:hypothetical protein
LTVSNMNRIQPPDWWKLHQRIQIKRTQRNELWKHGYWRDEPTAGRIPWRKLKPVIGQTKKFKYPKTRERQN